MVMRLILRLDPNRLRRWHVCLVERLEQRPNVELSIEWAETKEELPSNIPLLFALERLVYGLPGDHLAAAAEAKDFAPFLAAPREHADLVLDFSNDNPQQGERTWKITFDGFSGEAAALAALTQWRTPVVAVIDASTGVEIVSGHPGTESSGVHVLAFQDVLARTAALLTAALDGGAATQVCQLQQSATANTQAVTRFAVRSLSRALASWLYRLCYNAPHWRVGWRFVDGADVVDLRDHPVGGWRDLPDDGCRFYADPFPVAKN